MAQDGIISPLAVESEGMTGMRCLAYGAEMHLQEPDDRICPSGRPEPPLNPRRGRPAQRWLERDALLRVVLSAKKHVRPR
jgi:hypothetical protein